MSKLKLHNAQTSSQPVNCELTCAAHVILQVTRVVLLWVNNHFNDFEGDPAMTHFLEEFESNLEKEVSVTASQARAPACTNVFTALFLTFVLCFLSRKCVGTSDC